MLTHWVSDLYPSYRNCPALYLNFSAYVNSYWFIIGHVSLERRRIILVESDEPILPARIGRMRRREHFRDGKG